MINKPPIGTTIRPSIKIKSAPTIRIIPSHLTGWWRLYNSLLRDGWFNNIEPALNEAVAKGEIPADMVDYAVKLASLCVNTREIQKKYDYFQALRKYVDYLSGRLGKEVENG